MTLASAFRFLLLPSLFTVVSSAWAAGGGDAYSDLVAPVLQAKCVGCHGAEKQKGKLRMDSIEALLKGGSEGPALVPGKVEESLMMFRIDLPADDDERMPPEDEEQLTDAEVQLLRRWVEKGGSPSLAAADLGLDGAVLDQLRLASRPAAPSAPKKKEEQAPASTVDPVVREKVVREVNATGASLQQVAQDTPLLRFSSLNVADRFGDEELKKLAPAAADLMWMDLARTKVTDAGLATLAGMKNLTRLHLENTGISDGGLVHLAGLSRLEYLNLYNTRVTDAGLARLHGLKSLKKLYLWQSQATPAGVEPLRQAIPGLVVNLGWDQESKQAGTPKTETPVPVSAPAPAKAPASAAAAAGGAGERLKEALALATRLVSEARDRAAVSERQAKEAEAALASGQAQVAASLNAVAESRQRLAKAEEALKSANDHVAQAQSRVAQETRAAADAKRRIPELEAVANGLKLSLEDFEKK